MKQKFLLFFLLTASLFMSKAKANETEPNNSPAQASTLALNGSNSGIIGSSTDVDWYKVTTTADGRLSITLNISNGLYLWCALYDNDGVTQIGPAIYTNGTAVVINQDGLAAGTFYLKVYPYNPGEMPAYTISNALTAATPANDVEPNGTKALAKTLALNSSITGHIGFLYNNQRDSADWYKLTTNSDGRIRLTITSANGQNVYAILYDGNNPLDSSYTSGTSVVVNKDGLATGTYYVKIRTYYTYEYAPYTLSDSLFKPTIANDAEPDSTTTQALTLPLNGNKQGHIGYYYNNHRDSADWYKVTTIADGRLRLTMSSANNQNVYAVLYDGNGTTPLDSSYTSGTSVVVNKDGLAAGTYYIKVRTYYTYEFAPYTLSDSLFVPTQANDAEPNNSKAVSLTLPLNNSVTGHVNYYYNNQKDAQDWYKLVLPSDGMINIKIQSGNGQNVYAVLFDNDGTTGLDSIYTTTTSSYNVDGLKAGTYYIKVRTYYTSEFAPYTLTDTLYNYTYLNDEEPNGYAKQAKTLTSDKDNNGHVGFKYKGVRDTTDWFKINYTGNDGTMAVTLSVLPHISNTGAYFTWMTVYKDTAAAPLYDQYTTSSETANLTNLAKGYYYVKIHEYYPSDFAAYSIHPDFKQSRPRVTVSSYDTLADCLGNSITYKLSGSHAPFTVSLYRFGSFYRKATFNSTFATFDFIPDGVYYATALGDGAVGYAAGTSDTLTLMPIPTGTKTSAIGSDHAKFNWKVLSCADYYSVRYRVFGTSTWTYTTVAGTINYYSAQGLTSSTIYEWQISATDSLDGMNAKSLYSNSVAFSTTATNFAENNAYENDGLSVNGKQQTIYLGVYPNPASSYFTIHYNTSIKDKMNATLYDVNGKAVWASGSLTADALNGKQVNVNQFGSGLYYLKITDSKSLVIANTKVSVTK